MFQWTLRLNLNSSFIKMKAEASHLFLLLLALLVVEVEVAEEVALVRAGDDADVIAEALLLQKLLGQVLRGGQEG